MSSSRVYLGWGPVLPIAPASNPLEAGGGRLSQGKRESIFADPSPSKDCHCLCPASPLARFWIGNKGIGRNVENVTSGIAITHIIR